MRIVPGITALPRSSLRVIPKHDGRDLFERLSRLAKRGLDRLIILNRPEENRGVLFLQYRNRSPRSMRTLSTHDEEDLADSVWRGVGSPLPSIRLELLLPFVRPPPDLLELALVPVGRMDEDI